jgi:choice-of-anchor C domain-containing protein
MRWSVRVLLSVAAVLFVRPAVASPILTNGSFELGPPLGAAHDVDVAAGSTDILGWLVTGSGASAIDYLGVPWDVADGLHAVDLDGRNSSGSGIQQTFPTIIGHTYQVMFQLSGNPGDGSPGSGPPVVKQVRVSVGVVSHDYSFDSSGQTVTSLLWMPIALDFVATDVSETLVITSLTPFPNSYGPLIDDVSVVDATTVPEPSTGTLLVLSWLIAFSWSRTFTTPTISAPSGR